MQLALKEWKKLGFGKRKSLQSSWRLGNATDHSFTKKRPNVPKVAVEEQSDAHRLEAAVDDDFGAGDKGTGFRGGEEDGGADEFLGVAEP